MLCLNGHEAKRLVTTSGGKGTAILCVLLTYYSVTSKITGIKIILM